MCGIAGVFSMDRVIDESGLVRMAQALSHRGPDSEGLYINPSRTVGLAHRRLSIIDLSERANQPFTSQCGRYVMVFNGEVYNYKSIAKTLDIPLCTDSDTEVVLEAFVRWGPDFVEHLNGMFAIAIYDTLAAKIFLFRDRMGIKPLYYSYDGRQLAFASESKAILPLRDTVALNLEALKDYLFLEYIPAGQSIFKHIHKLEKGTALTLDAQGLRFHRYYDLLQRFDPQSGLSETACLDRLHADLENSLRLRQISDVPIGAFLSGGVDSSLICGMFQKVSKDPIATFNIGFENAAFDESGYAHQVAEKLKTDHRSVIADEDYALQFYQKVSAAYDEPFAAPSTFPTLLVCREAKKEVTVALSGDGGDELFMGYGYYNWMDRFTKMSRYGGNHGRRLAGKLLSLMGTKQARAARILDHEGGYRAWLHIWSQEQYMFSEREIADLTGQDYVHKSLEKDWKDIHAMDIHPYEKISLFDINHYLADNLLYKVDIASMHFGLEVRVPFLDHHFVESAINMPLHYKVNQGTQKYIQKRLLTRFLPEELVYRKKWGFPAPIGDWLNNGLRFLIETYLNEKTVRKQGIFNPYVIRRLLTEFRQGRTFHYKRVWALVFFQLWYKNYVDKSL